MLQQMTKQSRKTWDLHKAQKERKQMMLALKMYTDFQMNTFECIQKESMLVIEKIGWAGK